MAVAVAVSNGAITCAIAGTYKGIDLAIGSLDSADQGRVGLSSKLAEGASPQVETGTKGASIGVVITCVVRA